MQNTIDVIIGFTVVLIIIGLLVYFICNVESNYNKEIHSDDIKMTEWISPDGVHYWHNRGSNIEMLAPRYDHDGQLVID